MNDKIAVELLDFISKKYEIASSLEDETPNRAVIDVIVLVDKIGKLRGMDRNENGFQFVELNEANNR